MSGRPTPEELAERLAAHSAGRARRREEERKTEIVDAFAEWAWIGEGDDGEWVPDIHQWNEHGDPQEPMPTEREHGKRYCHGCGVKKRTASFDAVDGKLSERCRGCMGTESARRASAA
jgi:hypothetical protein